MFNFIINYFKDKLFWKKYYIWKNEMFLGNIPYISILSDFKEVLKEKNKDIKK